MREDGADVCERCLVATGALERMRGLLGRTELASDEGILLRPASSIHTAFMRFPIDVVFLDGSLTVLKVVPALGPWRTATRLRARSVLELAAGECERRGLAIGDRLELRA